MKKNSIRQVRVAFPMFTAGEVEKLFRYYHKYVQLGGEDSIATMGRMFNGLTGWRESIMDANGLARYFRDNYYDLKN